MSLIPDRYKAAMAVVLFFAIVSESVAAESPDFEEQILPLLYNRCFSCHSEKADEPKAGLRLDSVEAMLESGMIVPGKPDDSELLNRVSLPLTDEGHMPPLKGGSRPLSDAERDLVRRWIAAGAETGAWRKFDHREPAVEERGAPLARSDVPQLARRLDALVQAAHQAQGTQYNLPISDEGFLRRVYLDVGGRIPSLDEVRRFLDDTNPRKRSALIDSLLDGEAYVSHTFNWKADQLRLISKGVPGQPAWLYDDWLKDSIRSGMKYDEFVRQLVSAEGYLWETGAVGFYLRDMGMPLDHTSNMARVFLGTRIECAQCHDHPYEPVTQRDFYQLSAFTYGVSNLVGGGYSTDNVKSWDELMQRLKAMNAGEALRQNVSGTTAPLKRLTTDTDQRLTFPDNYANDASLRGKPVDPRTPFGDEVAPTAENRRVAFAEWMTSARNPRFAKNIANRLWKRVMGRGLIEPVDSLSPVSRPEHPEVLDFLTDAMCRLGFDERAYLAVLLNSRLYQSESVRTDPDPEAAASLAGPQLRRMSAEQIWDSLLTLLVVDLDERKPSRHVEAHSREQFVKLQRMTTDELMARSHEMMEYREQLRLHSMRLDAQKAELKQAEAAGDDKAVRQLRLEHAAANAPYEQLRRTLGIESPPPPRDVDRRWYGVNPSWIRAAEFRTPIALGHFLRRFGQSDRREIDAFNMNSNITHSLTLMNGELTEAALKKDSYLRKSLASVEGDAERVQAVYQAILARSPDAAEMDRCRTLFAESPTPETDLIWALINSPEFLFIQ